MSTYNPQPGQQPGPQQPGNQQPWQQPGQQPWQGQPGPQGQYPNQGRPQKPKKPIYKRVWFIVAAAIVLIIIISSIANAGKNNNTTASAPVATATASAPAAQAPAATAAAPSTPAAAPAPQVGQPFEVNMGSGDVAKITIVSATYAPTAGALASKPKNGGYLILDVLWETAKGETSANPLYFDAKDAAGRGGSTGLFADGLMTAGDVPAGDKVRGNVVFDIGAGPWSVIVKNPILQEKARVTVAAQ